MAYTIVKISDAWSFTAEAANLLAVSVELGRRGHHVVLASKPGTPLTEKAREAGVDVRTIAGFRPGWNVVAGAAAFGHVRRLLADAQPDVVHAYRSSVHSLVATVLRTTGRVSAPLVRTRANAERPRSGPLNRLLYDRWTARTIVSGEAVRRPLVAAGLDPARMVTIPGTVDVERFRPGVESMASIRAELELPADAFVIGCVARLAPVKGHRVLLQALAELPGAHLLLVGPPWPGMPEKVEAWGIEAGVWDRVTWIGGRDDVERVLSGVDVGVIASVGSEALSRAALEYMASGLPVVATRVGGIPELVPEEVGRLVEPKDAGALAAALGEVAALSAEQRAQMGEAGRARVLARHTLEHQVTRLLEVYDEVASSCRDR